MRVIHSELMETMNTSGERTVQLAIGASPHTTLRHPLDTQQVTVVVGLNRRKVINCLDMDLPQFIVSPSPLHHCNCPLQVFEPNSHTVTGHHCWLICYADFGNGHHHSHSRLCYLTIAQTDPTPPQNPSVSTPIITPSVISPSNRLARISSMVRHHMRSQRGRTRGDSSRPQTDPHPECSTSSPSLELHHP